MNNKNKVTIEYKVFKDARSQDMETMNIEVSEEIAIAFDDFRKKEHALEMQDCRYISGTGFEDGVTEYLIKELLSDTNCADSAIKNIFIEKLKCSFLSLTETQKRRINMKYNLELCNRDISRLENVNINAVNESINKALLKLSKELKVNKK